MIRHILTDVLCETFRNRVGGSQMGRQHQNAYRLTFDLSLNYETEEGYRYLDIVVYGPWNYIQVWVRERWTIIPIDDLEDMGDGSGDTRIKPGKDYQEGATEWQSAADHDSCWPDGVDRILRDYEDRLTNLKHAGGSFYDMPHVEPLALPKPQEATRYNGCIVTSPWERWKRNTRNVLESEPDMKLRHAHRVAYKALLADLVWEKTITDDDLLRRMGKIQPQQVL